VTTLKRGVLPDAVPAVYLDAMPWDEAAELLTGGLPCAPPSVVGRLLELTGHWPTLLGLVNGAARADVAAGLDTGKP
jgi:hypothetical protein